FLKFLILMKLTILLLLTLFLQQGFSAHAQRISIDEHDVTLHRILKEIRAQSGYDFFIGDNSLKEAKKINISIDNGTLQEVLDAAFNDQPFTYSIMSNA